MLDQNDPISALSTLEATFTIDPSSPACLRQRPIIQDVSIAFHGLSEQASRVLVFVAKAPIGVTPFFRSQSYVSRLAASLGYHQNYEHHDKTKTTAFAGTNSSRNSGR